ncbi:MAG TPA: helix-turn-helix transcriptional regulator [Alphaproteobacteria bacterium]|nr:helix-turn-helix transcriptional regulator [Alphaproteobacteria bacterium]
MPQPDIRPCEACGLGRSLKIWRAVRRMKQSHAAALLKVSQATVSRWEAGAQIPTIGEQDALRLLMSARLDSAGDHALGRLVAHSPAPVHLICDLTHRLLAASPGRTREWRVSPADLLGMPMWRYATPEIAAAEAALSDLGWFEPAPPAIDVCTGSNDSLEVPIRPGGRRWVRLQLSDGSFVRLVETLGTA